LIGREILAVQLQEQQKKLRQQQEDIKRQEELVTLQRKELLVKQQSEQKTLEKENKVVDLLAPMRLHVEGMMKKNQAEGAPAAAAVARPSSAPAPHKTRVDSRVIPNLDLDQVVDGYLLRQVVRLQRYVRRWLMRRHFVKVVQEYRKSGSKMAEKLLHRNKALQEIYTSELSYVASLQLLNNFYVIPMQVDSMVRKQFTDKDVQIIFSSVNTILDVSKGLVKELEDRLAKWPSVQLFGDIFIRLAPVMKLYAEYVNNFDSAVNRVKAIMATPEGLAFFETCKAKSRSSLDMNSLLIMPVQRVPRYELLLRELIRFTEETHVDYNNLVQAMESIRQVNAYINKKKKDIDSRQKLSVIQKEVKGCPNLVLAHRYYVREGPLQVSSIHKQHTGLFYFFLFNDMLMATKKGKLFHHHDYIFSIELAGAVVKRVADTQMFRIIIGGLEDINVVIYTFLCQSTAERDSWLKDFTSIQSDASLLRPLLVRESSATSLQGNSP